MEIFTNRNSLWHVFGTRKQRETVFDHRDLLQTKLCSVKRFNSKMWSSMTFLSLSSFDINTHERSFENWRHEKCFGENKK